jgi:hypothetical protein
MFDYVFGYALDSFWATNDFFEPGPFAFEVFFAVDFLAFSDFLKFFVYVESFFRFKFEFGEAAFIVDSYSGAIFYCLFNVVDINVFAENCRCAPVSFLYGCSSEADEGGVGECVSEIFCVSVL